MKLLRKPHRSTASDNHLIPMINVVFLLLIFFMLAGIVRISDPVALTAPESAGDNPVSAQSVLYVSSDGALMLDESSVSMDSLSASLVKLKAVPVFTETGPDISTDTEPVDVSTPGPQGIPLLAIKADAQVTVSLLRDIIHVVSKAGLSHVELITSWVPAVEQ